MTWGCGCRPCWRPSRHAGRSASHAACSVVHAARSLLQGDWFTAPCCPLQVVVVPILKKNTDTRAVLAAADALAAAAKAAGIRAKVDAGTEKTPGFKFSFWEMKVWLTSPASQLPTHVAPMLGNTPACMLHKTWTDEQLLRQGSFWVQRRLHATCLFELEACGVVTCGWMRRGCRCGWRSGRGTWQRAHAWRRVATGPARRARSSASRWRLRAS